MNPTKLCPFPVLLVLIACASEAPREERAPAPSGGPEIRVLLREASARPTVRLKTRAPYVATVLDSSRRFAAGRRLDRAQSARGATLEDGLLIRSEDGHILVDGVLYPGDLALHPSDTGVRFILRIDLERYLPGVLAGEMSAAFSPAALRAQAIASRTYAMHSMRSAPEGRPYHVTDDTGSQVFVGRPTRGAGLFDAAVTETAGMVLVWAGHPLPAYFHSTCGGHTAAVTEAFDGPAIPPLIGTPCEYCRKSRFYRWNAVIPAEDAGGSLSLGGPVRAARLGPASRTGRVQSLSFRGPSTRTYAAAEARMLLGPDRLFSTRISSMEVTSEGLLVNGSGWGHGVGMCQMGAWGMASRGASASDILAQYYPAARLLRLY